MVYLNSVLESTGKIYNEEELKRSTLEKVKEQIAKLCNIRKAEGIRLFPAKDIAYRVISGYVKSGEHIICSPYELPATKEALMRLGKGGVEISVLKVNAYGTIALQDIENLIKQNTVAIVCAHSCYATGNSTRLGSISMLARRYGIKLISDCTCSLGAADIDVFESGIDAFWAETNRFFLGPDEVAIAYSYDCCIDKADQTGEKYGTERNISPEIIDRIGTCLDLILGNGPYGFYMLPHRLAKRFFEATKAMTGVTIYGDFGSESRLPVVLLTAKQKTADEIVQFMEINGFICEKVTAPWLNDREMVQFSFDYYNNRRQVTDAEYVFMTFIGLEDFYLLS